MYNKNFPKQVGGTGPAAYNRPPMKYRNVPNQVGGEAPNKFIGRVVSGIVGAVQGFTDKDMKGQGFGARLKNAGATAGNAFTGQELFETQNIKERNELLAGAAGGAGGEGGGASSEEFESLKEQVEKNTYDISTVGGAGSGLTRKGNMYGRDTAIKYSDNNPLKRTGCVKGYKK